MTNKFNEGDDVFFAAYGWGVVREVSDDENYPIVCLFEETTMVSFTMAGRLLHQHIFPSLFTEEESKFHNFPPRPKKIVTKAVERWVIICSKEEGITRAYPSKEGAINRLQELSCPEGLQVVKLTGTYEVEE